MGYVAADVGEKTASGIAADSIETRVLTIPEMPRPDQVLDLPRPEPKIPAAGSPDQKD
jgi:hypothetical protein